MIKWFAIGIGFISAVLLAVLISLVFIKLGWYLFMVSYFNYPDLTWLQAFGFALLASSFKSSGNSKKD